MPSKGFNPLDPLGLFKKHDEEAWYQSLVPERRPGWRPPDPLHLAERAPDPLHILRRPENPGYRRSSGGGGMSGATIGNPIPIEWADKIVPLKNQAREMLIAKGYTPQQVDMALHWAEEWLMGIAKRLAPGNPALQETVVVSGYSEIADRAENWLRGIEGAFNVSPRILAAAG